MCIKVNEKDTIRSVIKQFVDREISGLPVVNDKNQIVAYVSDGDIMRYIGKHKDKVFGMYTFVTFVKGDDEEFEDEFRESLI